MDEPTFSSVQAALDHYSSLAKQLQCDLDDTKSALDEFQISSKELETELENELQATEKQLKDLRGKEESLLHEIDQWKNKFHSSLKDHTKTMMHMQSELESIRKSNEAYRTRLRDMELDNDALEGKERMVTSSLQDVESKYGKAIERITLLEDELIEKSRLEEECQRLKDDLRDTTEEIAILRDQQASLQPAAAASMVPTSPLLSPTHPPRGTSYPLLSELGMEVLEEPQNKTSPLRAGVHTKPASAMASLDNSPRRRLTSLIFSPSLSRDGTQLTKSVTGNVKSAASLQMKSPLAPRPNLHDCFSPNSSRAPTAGNVASTLTPRSMVRKDNNNHQETSHARIMRRQSSVESAERLVRPGSVQEHFRSHFRRQSFGTNVVGNQEDRIKRNLSQLAQLKRDRGL